MSETGKTNNNGENDILENIVVPENTQTGFASELEAELAKIEIPTPPSESLQVDSIVQNTTPLNSIIDININDIDDIFRILIQKEYDFVTIEPSETQAKLSFKKNNVEQEAKYIKYPLYSKILIKAKTITNLDVNETEQSQEGSGESTINNLVYKVISKTAPGGLGEKLFLKTVLNQQKTNNEVKKTSLSQIFGFLGALAVVALVVGGAFTSFVVLNAKTVDDVKFFYSLGINLNDINTFISKVIFVTFGTLVFIETLVLVIAIFKFMLTKKELKQKKTKYLILSIFVLIITFSSASAWLVIDKKVRALPNWQEMAYGDIQLYDNAKLKSSTFTKDASLLSDTTNLIGPVEIKFDVTFLAKKEEQKGFKIKKFIWNFGGQDIQETTTPTIIKNFSQKGTSEVSLTLQEIDLKGDIVEKKVDNVPSINIPYIVETKETPLTSGGKLITLDATNIQELGKVEWYFMTDLENPVWKGYSFKIGKPIFEETVVGMYINRSDKKEKVFDKIFVVGGSDKNTINGEIKASRGIINDLEYDFEIDKINNDFGNGFIEQFKWIIDGKEFTNQGDIQNQTESSKLKYEFKNYGTHEVRVVMTNSSKETKELKTTIDVSKSLKLGDHHLKISNGDTPLEDIKYENSVGEYYINSIGIPTTLKLDARFIKPDNILYTLDKVEWDFNADGNIDDTKKLTSYDINTPGNHNIEVNYTFVHRKIKDDSVKLKEKIFIEGVKKDAIIDFKIEKDNNYAPITVRFDASNSTVKDENIVKFIWDFGDGVKEERDAIVQGHKYVNPGDYTVTLSLVTESGKTYTGSKKIILQPRPQSVAINASMKTAPINQGIDFSSSKSEGQIVSYFWDFGDGEISTQANPSHAYTKPGSYTVKLKADFINNNVLEDSISIEITK